jgi:uncharacterized alpha-E superfamily protein
VRLAESANPRAGLLTRVSDHLMTFGADTEQAIPAALLDNLASVVQSASHVRDLFSVDGWAALKDLSKTAEGFRKRVLHAEDAARAVGVLLRKINGFSGLVHENMYRFTSWQFLSIGRSLERALFMTSVLRQFACEPVSDAALELAVEVGDSVMTHRRRYVVTTSRNTVIDLLVLDGLNPRSLLFHLTKIKEHPSTLPGVEEFGRLSEFARAVLRVHTNLTLATVETMTVEALEALRQDLWQLSDLLSVAYLR